MGAQWLSGRVLDWRPKGHEFEPHRCHCVVVLERDTFILALYWFNPGRTVPVELKDCWWDVKNQIKQKYEKSMQKVPSEVSFTHYCLDPFILCMLGNIACFFLSSAFFFSKSIFSLFFFKNITSVKQFESRSGPTFCRAWSGSKLFAKVTSRWH